MATVTSATPLLSLDAVVIDTETTGLDPRSARVVEIGAVRLEAGRLDESRVFRSLINPRVPIPAAASKIHKIDAQAVAEAPDLASTWPGFSTFVGNSIVIGHSLGFDIAVLLRECQRAGLVWRAPRMLDTRLLAQIAEPNLSGYSLEQLAAWLGTESVDRHSAVGDAITTARIFTALVPKLRERGIRTFAEASHACGSLTAVLDEQHRAGWVTSQSGGADRAAAALSRVDTYPYRHRVRDVMTAPPRIIAAERGLGEALTVLIRERISSLFVAPAGTVTEGLAATDSGILTERDILRALAIEGEGVLQLELDHFASRPLAVIPADAFVYRAIGRMRRLKVRHLGVTDESGMLVGALSARDLLRSRTGEAVSLGDEIDAAENINALGRAWSKLPHVAASLRAEDVPARDIAAIISRELGALTRQAAALAERRMRESGQGEPPCAYAVAVLGSAGRGESLLAMDQDNALIFERGEPDGPEDVWFSLLGTHIADILNQVGVPYCTGGVMGKNAEWRGSVSTWRKRIGEWIRRSRPQDLLSVDIFFDLRGVSGQISLAEAVWRYAFQAAKGQPEFAKLLAETAGEVENNINFFGGIRTSSGRIDLKRAGLFGIVSTARVLAIRHHVLERATPARLHALEALDIGGDSDLAALTEAQALFLDLILQQQLKDVDSGIPPSNAVEVKRLLPKDRERLRAALQAARHLNDFTRDLLFTG